MSKNQLVDLWRSEMRGMRDRAARDLWVAGLMLDENDNAVPMPPELDGLIGMAYAIKHRYPPK